MAVPVAVCVNAKACDAVPVEVGGLEVPAALCVNPND